MNTIHINTTNSKEITIRLLVGENSFEESSQIMRDKPGETLILIDRLCKKAGITVQEIKKIYVERGPGSFTGLRVGVAVANALSFALGIPVNDKHLGELEEPQY